MTNITIKNLEYSRELDQEAMADVVGGLYQVVIVGILLATAWVFKPGKSKGETSEGCFEGGGGGYRPESRKDVPAC
jgi:hypothetical protein